MCTIYYLRRVQCLLHTCVDIITGDRNAVSLSLTQSDDNKLIPPTRTIVLILLRHGEEEKCQLVIDPSVRSLDRTITLADYYESLTGSQSNWNIID